MSEPARRPVARGAARPRGRRRATHSMEAVIGEAVDLLDEAGEAALTFRALAARLGGGVASIYWYVASRDELLDRATDHVLAQLLEQTDDVPATDDPVADLRALAIRLFETIRAHPWTGAYMMRNPQTQPHAIEVYERLGQPVLRLGLSPSETFHAASAVLGFVIGTAIDLGQEPPAEVIEGHLDASEYLDRYADHWRELDAERFPFIHAIAEEFAAHDDADQFRAGLDLLLAGLRLQAGSAPVGSEPSRRGEGRRGPGCPGLG